MKVCPNCKTENPADSTQFCQKCGTQLSTKVADFESRQDDDLEFVVTETPGAQAPDLLGGGGDARTKEPTDGNDDLEITSEANLLEDTSTGEIDLGVEPEKDIKQPDISETTPEPPETQKGPKTKKEPEIKKDRETVTERLSDEEIAAVKKNLYGPDKKPKRKAAERGKTPEDKQKMNAASVRPIEDPAKTTTQIKKAQKVRGLAHFRGNSVKIVGNPFLHDGDEIIINNKPYLLRPQKIDKRIIFGAAAAFLVVILSIIAIQFTNNQSLSGEGEIVGMVLDEDGRPFLEQARVTIPYLNKITSSNAQGFFRFQKIPTGTYELIFELSDDNIYQGNATVTSNQLTLMAFNEFEPLFLQREPPASGSRRPQAKAEPPKTFQKDTKPSGIEKKSSSKYGKIKLKANVENARLIVDDKILGAGNNTYTKIKPGNRKIQVTKDGYKGYTELTNVRAGRTITITAELSPAAPASLTGKDYLSLGKDALTAKDYSGAINNLTKAVELSPNLAEAYESRGSAFIKTGETNKALSDYVKAGEIFRFKKKHDEAISAFSSALEISKDNNSALIGRGGARLDRGDYRSAIEDFNSALNNNRRQYSAQYGIAKCHFKMGNHKKAEKYFKAAFKLDTTDPQMYQYMMLNYLARDNIKKVREMYSEFKAVADPTQLAKFKSSSRYEPVLRLIKEENR